MANLIIGYDDNLVIPSGDHFSVGTLENHGSATGAGTLGLDWTEPITGDSAAVECPVVEENIPAWSAVPFVGTDFIRIEYSEIGASVYSASLDGGSPVLHPPGHTEFLFSGLDPQSDYVVTLAATNSRDNSITREFYITLFASPNMYRVITQTFEQADRNREQNCAFLARITDVLTDAPLSPADVDSITLNAFRLVKNVKGRGRVPVSGFTDIPVDSSAVCSAFVQNSFWTRDNYGYNFFHAPEQVIKYLLPVPGSYQIEYEIRLTEGNPIKICYEMLVY